MHNSRIKRISLAVCFALMPVAACAAGLGKLTVISGLGEPLNAEVELLSTSQEEISSLSAQIAPNEIFAEQGIERASALSGVRVEIGKRPDGTPVLRLTSSQPINDPFLDMLLQVEWSSGRLLREYTALLDPPGFGDQSNVSHAAIPESGSSQVATTPGSASDKIPNKFKAGKGGTVTDKVPPVDKADGYTTQKGDTLRAIAGQNPVEGVSLEQMLVGLYHTNKDAFVGNNMNRLKVGQIIHVPSQVELMALSQQEAIKEIHVQTADWNTYRNKLAGMVKDSSPAMEDSSKQATSGKIAAPAQDNSVPPAPGPRDVVKLSKSETDGATKAGSSDISARLTALQEEATAREKMVKESGERVAALEKQLQDMQKLLEIKNKSLAEAQKGAVKAPAPVALPPKPVADAPKPADKPAEPPKVQPVAPPPEVEHKPEPPKPEVEKTEPPKPEAKPPQKKPKKVIRPPAVPVPKAEPGILDDLLGNPLTLVGAGGLLALIGGVWLFLRNKRRKGLDSFEQGILTTGGLKPNTVFGNTAGGTVDTGNTSFLTDFEQGSTSGMIDTHEVDPIAEAEVYMAYGRDVQAEEILKDAIAKEPKRYELHLKLLEIFVNRKDSGAFETLAGELYASLGATDPTWAKVAEIGHKFEPDNPLYSGKAVLPKAEAEPTDFDATMIQQAPVASSEEAISGLDIAQGGTETTLDFSLDEPVADSPDSISGVSAESNTLDFDIGALELPMESAGESQPGIEVPAAELDLSLPLESDVGMSLDTSDVADEPEAADLDFQLDLPEPASESNVQLDAADLGIEALSNLPKADQSAPANSDRVETIAEEVSLDMPGLELPTLEEAAPTKIASLEADHGMTGLSLDLPMDDSMPEPVSLDIDLAGALEIPAMTKVTDDVDQTAMLELPVAPEAASKLSDEPTETDGGLDFNFDVDLGEPASQENVLAAPVAAPLPDLDLSGISLDVGDGIAAGDAAATEEITLSASSESADVDTKLDLVTAYIDMGDQEGARELLQEVLKEGGPTQRDKAQKLLNGLG